MNIWVGFAATLALLGLTFAKTAECIIGEIDGLKETIQKLDCSLENFHYDGGSWRSNIPSLWHVSQLNVATQNRLRELIEGIQTSCPFSNEDSQNILLSLSAVNEPITHTLKDFKAKHNDFKRAVGPCITHRVVGGGLLETRCLTMDLLRSLEAKADPNYKEIISATKAELDSTFQQVLSIY